MTTLHVLVVKNFCVYMTRVWARHPKSSKMVEGSSCCHSGERRGELTRMGSLT